MSAIDAINVNFNNGLKAMSQKNFLLAARYFRIVYNSDFGFDNFSVRNLVDKACTAYDNCKKQLTVEAQHRLDAEERNPENRNWDKMVAFDSQMIEKEAHQPSPNKPSTLSRLRSFLHLG